MAALRRIGRAVLWIVLGGIALLAAALWIAGRETTLQYFVGQLVARSDGQVRILNTRGGLYQGLAFDRLEFTGPDLRITVEDGAITWEPALLLARTVLVTSATARKVTVEVVRESKEPARYPETLRAPVLVAVPALHVDTLEILHTAQRADGSVAAPQRLDHVDAGVRFDGERWNVEKIAAATPWGAASGHATLGAERPFAASGTVALDLPGVTTGTDVLARNGYRADATLSGSLHDLQVSGAARAGPGSATFDALLAPFAAQPLTRAHVATEHVSPHRFDPAWPEADLGFRVDLVPDGGHAFKGIAALTNTAPGPLDAARLPLAAAQVAFAGDAQAVTLSGLTLDFGAGGRAHGKGTLRIAGGVRPVIEVDVEELNLAALHTSMRPTHIRGSVSLAATASDAVTLKAALSEQKLALEIEADLDRAAARVRGARLRAGKGVLAFSGEMQFAAPRVFTAQGTLASFNPRDLGNFPAADLSGTLAANGALAPPWHVTADLKLAPGRVEGRPVEGNAHFTASATEIRDVDVALAFATNRIAAHGSFGRAGDTLAWSIAAANLAELGADFAGSIDAHGDAAGTFAAPHAAFTLDGKDIKVFGVHRIARITGSGALALDTAPAGAGAQPRADAQLALTGYRGAQLQIDRANIAVQGNRAQHTIRAAASNADFDLSAEVRGGLGADRVWRGQLADVQNRGRVPLRLRDPADLVAGPGQFELRHALFAVSDGSLAIERIAVQRGALVSRGRAQNLPVALALQFSEDLGKQVASTLRIGAEWDIDAAAASAGGRLRVFRESGDLQFLTEPRFATGLDQFELDATVAANSIEATLQARGAQLGRIDATAHTRLERRDGVWGVPGSAPVTLRADLDIPTLAWITRLAGPPGVQLDGRLRAHVTGDGTFATPRLHGTASGEKIAFAWPDQGIHYSGGTLEAEFSDDSLTVKRVAVNAGGGTLVAEGALQISGTRTSGRLHVAIDRFEAVSRPDRVVVASGEGALQLDQNRLTVTAGVKAERGVFELPDKTGPTISDDVVILGKAEAAEKQQRRIATRVDIKLDLGEQFRVRGAGLDGRLAGTLQVASDGAGIPRAIGSVRIEDGTYTVYGQKLAVERGILTFAGPADNPGIDLLAVRKNPNPSMLPQQLRQSTTLTGGQASSVTTGPVEAGVEVRGSVLAPQARLVSTPNVPETEKLAWLILGHGLANSSSSDFGLLSAAASGLLGSSQSASLQAKIANSLGVDEFGITAPSGKEGGLLTVGKRVSSQVYLTYEQGIGKVSNLLKIRYLISPRWSVQAATGTENAVDVFYTLSFDSLRGK